ncbi:hypothetical protein E4U21_003897 [Claviceps maximensis]|nr:hypothetical protein E4U21_003897 [Claviceps maximensis]
MLAKHTSDDTLSFANVNTAAGVALSEQLNAVSTLDPSVRHPFPDTTTTTTTTINTSPRLQTSALPAAAPTRLPRTSSLLPLPRTGAAAATTTATTTTTTAALTPTYSSGEPSFNTDIFLRSDNLPETPPNELDYETDLAPDTTSFNIGLSPPSLPLIPRPRLRSLSDSLGRRRPSSLEVLPGGESSDNDNLATLHTQNAPLHSSGRESLSEMSFDQGRESHAPLHSHSRYRSARGSMDINNKTRGTKPPSQKAMLSRALQMANTAVQLDNAQNFEGARRSYVEACDLLKQVLLKTTADEDKKKLDAIRRTYDARIEELDQILPWQAMNNKELPAPPGTANDYSDDLLHASILEVETEINALSSARGDAALSHQRKRQDSRYFSDSSVDTARTARLKAEQPPLHSTFSRSTQKLRTEAEEYPSDNNHTSQPLINRRASSPRNSSHERGDSGERGMGSESYNSGSWSDSRDGAGHFRDGSQNSWLDPIHESGGSSAGTSVHSRDSSRPRSEHFRKDSGNNTEVEFDTALDAAIEAVYDDGFEPMDPRDYDIIDRTEEIVTKALRKVEEARERVRLTESEAYSDKFQRPAAQARDEPQPDGFYDDNLSSDEEERILEGMTREYNLEEFLTQTDDKLSFSQRPESRSKEAQAETELGKQSAHAVGNRSRAASVEKSGLHHSQNQQQHTIPKGWQPSAPPPQQSLPELPLSRAASPGQSVRSRRLSGQNPKQLKIQTNQIRQPPATSHGEPTQTETITEVNSAIEAAAAAAFGERPQTSHSTRKMMPTAADVPVPGQEPAVMASPPNRRSQPDADDGRAGHSSSPSISRLRKNFSSSSLRSLKSRNLSLSNFDDAFDRSPGTPSSLHPGSAGKSAIPALPTPLAVALREQMDAASPASFYLFEDNIHLPATPGSPNPLVLDPPVALEPCPSDIMLRPFWLMRCLYQTLAHPRGGYLSTKLFVPRDVWRVKSVKLKYVEDKISNCDLLTAALVKLSKVDTCDADAILEEMQTLESILEQVQNALTRKLGHDVGVHGSGVLFKEASNVVEGDGVPVVPRAASVSGKSSSFSWRRLRSKNSNMGLGGAYSSRSNGSSAEGSSSKEAATMPTLPMTPQPTSRPPRREITQVQFIGPNANYTHALARLFDAAQAIDLIARQVDDPGLKHADKTQVGLELCVRHAAEFFGFYVCRFVLADLGLLLDKFIKRGSEWVLA